MGGIGKAISGFADDALGFDPNGGGFVPIYDMAGTALGVGPVGTMGATGVNAVNQISGQGGQQGQGALGQILGGVGAGVAQAQKNKEQDKLADALMSYLNKGINTQKGMYDKSLALQNKVLADAPKLVDTAEKRGINALSGAYNQAQGTLKPYELQGVKGLNSLTDLTLSPQKQADFIKNNPFYNAMVGDAQSRLMKNQASRGKLGSGDTAKALQDEVLKIGSDLMQGELGNRQGLANYGLNASGQKAGLYGNSGMALSNLVNNNAQFKSGIQQAGANNITNLNTGMGNTLSNLFKEQSDIVGNKMANQASPWQAGVSQFLQPTQGQQSGGGLGGILGSIGGLFGGGDLLSVFGGGSPATVSTGGGSFGSFGTSGFGF